MNNVIKDIGILTTIPELNLKKLVNIAIKIISHDIVECVKEGNTSCTEDIGIGTISIDIEQEDLRFKFTPSQQLQTAILNSIESKDSELVIEVENILKEKIVNTYKSLL